MGYIPNYVAKSLVSKKTYTIGVVVPEISHSFFPEVIRGIEQVIYNMSYQLILTHSAEMFEQEKKVIETLRSKRVDGILISCSQKPSDSNYYQNLAKSNTQFVFFDRCIEDIGVSCISVNDKSASRQLTEHLNNLKYKRIAHLGGPKAVSIGANRFEGDTSPISVSVE